MIPAAAGLGGGSSDAAAVLNGLSTLVGEPVDAATLEGLARDIILFYGLLPSAALTVVLARRYNRDADLVATIVFLTRSRIASDRLGYPFSRTMASSFSRRPSSMDTPNLVVLI